jgi:c-di-GMP-binding flagellar brake protein YcgR
MSNDRRRYFRITDQVGVAYRVVDESELEAQTQPSRPGDIFGILSELDKTITTELQALQMRDPSLAYLLDAFDKKINAVINQLEMDNYLVQRIAHKVREVNISACGMGFQSDETLADGTLLMVDLMLTPDNINIFTYARVISCESLDEEGHFVRVEFFGMNSTDQELLIQHIVRRQGYLIRSNWQQ